MPRGPWWSLDKSKLDIDGSAPGEETMHGYRSIAAGFALVLGLGLASAGHADPLKVRVGWAVVPSQLTSIIFVKKDILKHYGTSYTV